MSISNGASPLESGAPRPQAQNQENPAAAANGGRHRRRILYGIFVLAAVAAGVFAYWLIFMWGIVYTDDARFAGHLVDVAPEINGRVIEVAVHEGQFIHKDAVIFRLDPAIAQAAMDRAEATLVSARASLASSDAL